MAQTWDLFLFRTIIRIPVAHRQILQKWVTNHKTSKEKLLGGQYLTKICCCIPSNTLKWASICVTWILLSHIIQHVIP